MLASDRKLCRFVFEGCYLWLWVKHKFSINFLCLNHNFSINFLKYKMFGLVYAWFLKLLELILLFSIFPRHCAVGSTLWWQKIEPAHRLKACDFQHLCASSILYLWRKLLPASKPLNLSDNRAFPTFMANNVKVYLSGLCLVSNWLSWPWNGFNY